MNPVPLNHWQVLPYLLSRRLVDVDRWRGLSRVRRLPGRNANVALFGMPHGFVLKQASGRASRNALAREAEVYRYLRRAEGRAAATGDLRLPRLLSYDAERGVLVLEWVRRSRTLDRLDQGDPGSTPGVTEHLGRAIAELQRIPLAGWEPSRPWILDFDRPRTGFLREASGAGLELVRHVQGSTVWSSQLAAAREQWSPEVLSHHDLRWSNCLVVVSRDGSPEVVVVDWELAGPGDPGWDPGWVMAESIARAQGSFHEADLEIVDSEQSSGAPGEDGVWPLLRAFWDSFLRALEPGQRVPEPADALQWAALRLLQIVFERSSRSERLSGHDRTLLDRGEEILVSPGSYASRMGLGVGS